MISEKIIDFSLKNVDEKIYKLNDLIGSNGTLVMFICNHCPYVKAIITKLVTTTRELEKLVLIQLRLCLMIL